MAAALTELRIWCDEDDHRRFEDFVDFNEWLDSDDGADARIAANISGLAQPSKAFFAGDREAYDEAFQIYRAGQRHGQLCKAYIDDLTRDDHWSERNEQRFDQLCDRIEAGEVVPFVGAGLSQPGGFPTWKDHLRKQARTAGMDAAQVETKLNAGDYEEIVDDIERVRGQGVFVQELRDAFSRTGVIPNAIYLLVELFPDTIITTNYDRLIEQAFDTGGGKPVEVVTPATIETLPDPTKITVIKLHGDARVAAGCILSKSQYEAAYGSGVINRALPIPQVLDYQFRNSSLLFLGCSLNQDRTVRVFQAIKDAAGTLDIPQHFAVEQCPEDESAMQARNEYLLRLGITPIWFEAGRFECVEGLLRLIRNEIRYRRKA
jgi:SIR2-like domain